jgi:hypothetical protein
MAAALWIMSPARVARTRAPTAFGVLLNSWSRPAPSVRRQHRSTEEDRQHQERQTGCRLLPKHAIDPFDSLGQGKGRDSVRLDHHDEGPSHENRRAEMRIKQPADEFGNTAERQSRR